jgi:hypothetical protein
MDGRLLERIPSEQRVGLLDLVQDLRREVVSLRQEVADLRRAK